MALTGKLVGSSARITHPQAHLGRGWSIPIDDMALEHLARMIQEAEKMGTNVKFRPWPQSG